MTYLVTIPQGTEFDNLADTVLMDRFDRLVDLLTLTGEKGKLPIVMALANVVPSQQMVTFFFLFENFIESLSLFTPWISIQNGFRQVQSCNGVKSYKVIKSVNLLISSSKRHRTSPLQHQCVIRQVDCENYENDGMVVMVLSHKLS